MKTPEEIYKYYTGETLDDKQLTKKAMIEYGKQLLEEYTNRIVENAKIEWSGSMVTGNVDKESITSQLPKFLKELE